jgi:hypothetical protein
MGYRFRGARFENEALGMSDNPAEKSGGFERWVASLKLGKSRPTTDPPGEDGEGSPLPLDEQATLINRIPKEVIYKLRERDSQRTGVPKSDDSTAVFTPPPELLARARRFQAPPKPERSSPTSAAPPVPTPASPVPRPGAGVPRPGAPVPRPAPPSSFDVGEAAAFAGLNSDEEATTYFKPDIAEIPPSVPPPAPVEQNAIPTPLAPPPFARRGTDGIPTPLVPPPEALSGDVSRPGDINWIDGLPSEPPKGLNEALPIPSAPPGGSIAPGERRLRWIAILVAIVLIGGIILLSRMQ